MVERVNLTVRQAFGTIGAEERPAFVKTASACGSGSSSSSAFYNMARPHMSLRHPLPLHERIHRGAIRPRWRVCTPAMAAGLTDHVWTFHELLTAKFEPLESQSISQ